MGKHLKCLVYQQTITWNVVKFTYFVKRFCIHFHDSVNAAFVFHKDIFKAGMKKLVDLIYKFPFC